MPIKFRCEYCRQLMGIAQSKAGTLVDCPTCGRTLRVPNKDGTKDPPPKPRVNLADDGLRKALDELAQLGGESTGRDDVPLSDRPTPAAPRRLVPSGAEGHGSSSKAAGAPAVVELPVNPQLDVVALEPLPPMKVVDPPARGVGGGAVGVSPEQILAAIPNRPAPSPPVAAIVPVAKPARVVSLQRALIGMSLSLMVGAGGGYAMGRYLTPTPPPAVPAVAAPAEPAPEEPAVVLGQIKGTLSYHNPQSQVLPDAGACILVLPASTESWSKLPVSGFRPNDDDVSRQAAMTAIAEHGGRLVEADEEGNYEVEIPEEGDYTIVYLSHYQRRAEDEPGVSESLRLLEDYFDRPSRLIGQLAFHVASLKHPGEISLIVDHTFGE